MAQRINHNEQDAANNWRQWLEISFSKEGFSLLFFSSLRVRRGNFLNLILTCFQFHYRNQQINSHTLPKRASDPFNLIHGKLLFAISFHENNFPPESWLIELKVSSLLNLLASETFHVLMICLFSFRFQVTFLMSWLLLEQIDSVSHQNRKKLQEFTAQVSGTSSCHFETGSSLHAKSDFMVSLKRFGVRALKWWHF